MPDCRSQDRSVRRIAGSICLTGRNGVARQSFRGRKHSPALVRCTAFFYTAGRFGAARTALVQLSYSSCKARSQVWQTLIRRSSGVQWRISYAFQAHLGRSASTASMLPCCILHGSTGPHPLCPFPAVHAVCVFLSSSPFTPLFAPSCVRSCQCPRNKAGSS